MVKKLIPALLLFTFLSSSFAQQITLESTLEHPSLLELFSSEGCSSCPPAEEWISKLRTNPGLWKQFIPVVFHVDYWNSLGWTDRFSRQAYSQRQQHYQEYWRASTIYTPEFYVNGREWHGWTPPPAARGEGQLIARINPPTESVLLVYYGKETTEAPLLHIAWLGMGLTSIVTRGENAGKKLTHDFVVLDFKSARPNRDAQGEISLQATPSLKEPITAVAVWVSNPQGEILQAVAGWVPPSAVDDDRLP